LSKGSVVLTSTELNLLGRLDLSYRRPQSGLYAGERRSPRSARSPEFSDFRPYVSGDDLRQIDWAAYARLEKLMLRLYVAEEEACLNVVLDTSASMTLGEPAKWPAARRLVAALGFLGLAAMDRVQVGTLAGARLPPQRGRDGVPRTWAFLRSLEPSGATGPDDLRRLRWLRPGVTMVVSDFLVEDADWTAPLAALAGRRQEPVLWQVLAPDEERPTISGDLKLVDHESGRARELTITPSLVGEYQRALAAHRQGLSRATQATGGRFLSSGSADDLETMMLAGLRAGAVRRR
jgi:uncharacterized protein (DUF58 family)